jgi:hypothetical protein
MCRKPYNIAEIYLEIYLLFCLTLRGWRHIQNLCGFSTPAAVGQSFVMTLYKLPSSSHKKTFETENFGLIIAESSDPYLYSEKNFHRKRKEIFFSNRFECQFILRADLVRYSNIKRKNAMPKEKELHSI